MLQIPSEEANAKFLTEDEDDDVYEEIYDDQRLHEDGQVEGSMKMNVSNHQDERCRMKKASRMTAVEHRWRYEKMEEWVWGFIQHQTQFIGFQIYLPSMYPQGWQKKNI